MKWEDFRPGDMLVYTSENAEEDKKEAVLVLSAVPEPRNGVISMLVLVMWSQQTPWACSRSGVIAWGNLRPGVNVTWWTVVGRSDH